MRNFVMFTLLTNSFLFKKKYPKQNKKQELLYRLAMWPMCLLFSWCMYMTLYIHLNQRFFFLQPTMGIGIQPVVKHSLQQPHPRSFVSKTAPKRQIWFPLSPYDDNGTIFYWVIKIIVVKYWQCKSKRCY